MNEIRSEKRLEILQNVVPRLHANVLSASIQSITSCQIESEEETVLLLKMHYLTRKSFRSHSQGGVFCFEDSHYKWRNF